MINTGNYDYEKSDIEWLENIPREWGIARMDDLAITIKEQLTSSVLKGLYVTHYSIPSVQACGVGLVEDGSSIDSNKFRVKEGDVLFSKLNPRKETITIVQKHEQIVVSSTEFVVLRPKRNDSRFLKYLLHTSQLKSFVCSQVESATRSHQRINPSVISKLKIAIPKFEIRVQIANFLDHETAKIDTLIEKQQQLIKLLKEKRQAVISHAVTKGLNPDVPMKDSGVEWLGEVPEHWEVTQFRRFTKLSQGLQIPQSDRFYEKTKDRVEYITIKSLNAGSENDNKEYIQNPSQRVTCSKKCILLARTGATGEVVTGVEGAFHNNFFKVNYNQNHCIQAYLVALLKVKELKNHLVMLAGTTTIPDLNHGAFLSSKVPLPNKMEQQAIADYCEKVNSRFSEVMEKADSQISLLKERRTALISAAVTGKIDVRNWQPENQPTQANAS